MWMRLENRLPPHRKFWQVRIDGNRVWVEHGRIDVTCIKEKPKVFGTHAAAAAFVEAKVREKEGRGYSVQVPQSSQVLCSAAGHLWRYGSPTVEQCSRCGEFRSRSQPPPPPARRSARPADARKPSATDEPERGIVLEDD